MIFVDCRKPRRVRAHDGRADLGDADAEGANGLGDVPIWIDGACRKRAPPAAAAYNLRARRVVFESSRMHGVLGHALWWWWRWWWWWWEGDTLRRLL